MFGEPSGQRPRQHHQEVSWSRVALAYVGTVVGAGFASGQEVVQFFGLLGKSGLYAMAVSTVCFAFFGYAVMSLGRAHRALSHRPIVRAAMGNFLAPFVDLVITFFLFGATSTMLAGAGSLMSQEFGLEFLLGSSLMATVTALTVISGLRGVISSLSSVAPFLIAGVLLVGTQVIRNTGVRIQTAPPGYRPVLPGWALCATAYVSYNLVMAAPVLGTMATRVRDQADLRKSAVAGALGLGLCLLASYCALVSSFPESLRYEVPMAKLAESLHPLGKPLYSAVFLLEVYTTAVANLYGFASRIRPEGTRPFRWVALGTVLAALLCANVGFSRLVRTVYPLSGVAGFLFLGGLSREALQRAWNNKNP